MKSFGTVIDESIQSNKQLIPTHQSQPQSQPFPQPTATNKTVESYATVLEQSIITQDKPLLKDIIINSDTQMLVNSVSALNVSKVSQFLRLLEQLLLEDCQHTQIYVNWLKQLISRHLGVLLSNPENKEIVLRLRRWIQKRVANRSQLLHLKNSIPSTQQAEKKRDFQPRFKYFEEEQKNNQGEQVIIDEAAFADEDLYDDDLEL